MTEPRVAMMDGTLLPFQDAVIPIDDRGLLFGESLYEVIPVVGDRPCRLELHLERLRHCAAALALDAGVPTPSAWHEMTTRLHEREQHPESLLYFQITGGSGPRVHVPATTRRPRWFAVLRAHRFPTPEESTQGVAVITLPELRWDRRDLKTTMLLPAVWAKQAAAAAGAYEAIFVASDDRLLEGASSNLFVVRGEEVVTPPLGTELLAGITRRVVLEAAARLGLRTEQAALRREDVLTADEVFVASTSQLCRSVGTLDGLPLRTNATGVVARLCRELRRDMGLPPES